MYLWIPLEVKQKLFQEMKYEPYDWQENFHYGYIPPEEYPYLYEQMVEARGVKGHFFKTNKGYEYLIPLEQDDRCFPLTESYPPEPLYVPAQVRGLFTLPRAGKTFSGARELVAHMVLLPNLRVWLVSKEYYSAKRGWRMIVNLLRKHFNYLLKNVIVREGDNEYRIELYNGTLLELKSEQNKDRLQTFPVHVMWIDELVSADIFGQYLLPRIMDTDGIMFLTSTLNKDNSDWVKVLLRKLAKRDPYLFRPYFMLDPTKILHFSEDVHHLMKIAKDLDSFAQITLQDESLDNLTLPIDEENLLESFSYEPDDFIVVGVDWGRNGTGICVLVERDKGGKKEYIVTESYWFGNFYINKLIDFIKSRGLDAFPIVIDPSARQRRFSNEKGLSTYDRLLEQGWRVYLGSNDIDLGFQYLYDAVKNKELKFVFHTNRRLLDKEIPIATKKHLRDFRHKRVDIFDALRYAFLWLKGTESYIEKKNMRGTNIDPLEISIRKHLKRWGLL